MISNNSTTLERSLASIGADHNLTSAPVDAKKKRKNHKKHNQKNKVPTATNASVGFADETDDGWMPVVSKKTKINALKEASSANPITQSEKTSPPPVESKSPDVAQVNKRRRSNKPKSTKDPRDAPEEKGPDVAITEPQIQNHVEVRTPKQPQQRRQKSNSINSDDNTRLNHSDALTYAHNLELLVSEVLGGEAILKARAAFPKLSFPRPPPNTTVISDPTQNVLFSDFIQMKAHLRAKEAECQVLRDEVVRLHSKNSPAVAMPTESSVQPSKPHHKQKPVSTASKHVQCDMVSANSAKAEATATPPPPVQQTTPSMDSLVIKTLQEEIARLAQENTLLTQRQARTFSLTGPPSGVFIVDLGEWFRFSLVQLEKRSDVNLEGRLETSKRLNAKLQSEAHKAGAEAAKKAEATVRQQMDDVIKKLRAELTETSHLLRSKTAQLELTEQTNETNAQNLHHIQAEYNEVVEANNALKQEMGLVNVQAADAQRRLGESLQMLANLEKEHEAVLQQLAIAQSSLQTEVNSGVTLRHRLAETEAQLEATCSQSDHLKADLVNTQCQLTSTKQALAELKENYDRDLSALTTRVKDLEAEKEELLKAREQEVSQAPQPQSPVETPEADASSSSGCAECAVLAAEVERFTSILAVTEVALSQLQLSVDQEESRWRSALQESSAENAALKSKIDALTAERDQALEECNEVIENGDACSGEHNFSPSIVANGGTSSTVENHSIDIA
ncbi:unnamed protein product [Mesocestoides corti]|uniref:Uncharacterized protein n=1 Tax=Mesocestoides corti TaxID=53468 RepID=A0A0R3U2J5_MESCO|nr:unnamed protein product [Mesocestoides corti]